MGWVVFKDLAISDAVSYASSALLIASFFGASRYTSARYLEIPKHLLALST